MSRVLLLLLSSAAASSPLPLRPGQLVTLYSAFTSDLRLDLNSTRNQVRAAVQAGVTGFLCPSLAMEVDVLSDAEQEAFLRVTLKEAARKPGTVVVGGVYANTSAAAVRLAKRWLSLNVSGIDLWLPYNDSSSFIQAVHEVAQVVDVEKGQFLVIQDTYADAGIPVDVLANLAKAIPAIVAVKEEVTGSEQKSTEVIEAVAAAGGSISMAAGAPGELTMIESLDRGITIFAYSGLFKLYTFVSELYRMGHRGRATCLFDQMLPLLIFKMSHGHRFLRQLFQKQGIFASTNDRKSEAPWDVITVKKAATMVDFAIDLEDRVGASFPTVPGCA